MIRPLWTLAVIFVALGATAALLPEKRSHAAALNPEQMLGAMLRQDYIYNVDQLADLLIQKDPSIQLIDVRPADAYAAYSLPGAINIPLDSLLSPTWAGYVDQEVKKNIFYSNGSTRALQAWMLTRQRGYRNNYLLAGGLNHWFEAIIQPQAPPATAPEAAFIRYQTRLAASQYFSGAEAESASSGTASKPLPALRKKKKMVKGGCS
jgi:rhodanese-related sulfurtransferase